MIREAAWEVLRSGAPVPMREVDGVSRARGLSLRDRGLVRQLVGTEIRRRGSLRALVAAMTRRRPKPELSTHLHLGFVQLLFLDRIPDHAAVSETCDAVARTVGASKVPFVHGVLRNAIRARRKGLSGDPRRDLVDCDRHLDFDVFRDKREHPLLWAEDALSIPAALMKRWGRRLGEERAERLARTFLHPPPLVLRVRGARGELRSELEAEGIATRDGRGSCTLLAAAESAGAVARARAFRRGAVTIQGETAAEAGALLAPREGERLLDLCAAPGGKTAILAESGARVVAVDVDRRRLRRVSGTLRRLGLAERVDLLASDGAGGLRPELLLDGVLVDAPCSNTGVLGARPEARWRFGPQSQQALCELQGRLLAEGAACVRPGGRLVYATCSLEPEENERRVASFLADRTDWTLEEELVRLPDREEGPFDGGYAARLRRAAR